MGPLIKGFAGPARVGLPLMVTREDIHGLWLQALGTLPELFRGVHFTGTVLSGAAMADSFCNSKSRGLETDVILRLWIPTQTWQREKKPSEKP